MIGGCNELKFQTIFTRQQLRADGIRAIGGYLRLPLCYNVVAQAANLGRLAQMPDS